MVYVSSKPSNIQLDFSTENKKNESLYFGTLINYMINCIKKEKVTSAAKFHGMVLGA